MGFLMSAFALCRRYPHVGSSRNSLFMDGSLSAVVSTDQLFGT